jgi:hypothetical protein
LLLLLHRWQVQVPELVSNEVQAAKSDLSARLHLLNVVEPEDETHLKHNESTCKRPLPSMPTVRSIYSNNTN